MFPPAITEQDLMIHGPSRRAQEPSTDDPKTTGRLEPNPDLYKSDGWIGHSIRMYLDFKNKVF